MCVCDSSALHSSFRFFRSDGVSFLFRRRTDFISSDRRRHHVTHERRFAYQTKLKNTQQPLRGFPQSIKKKKKPLRGKNKINNKRRRRCGFDYYIRRIYTYNISTHTEGYWCGLLRNVSERHMANGPNMIRRSGARVSVLSGKVSCSARQVLCWLSVSSQFVPAANGKTIFDIRAYLYIYVYIYIYALYILIYIAYIKYNTTCVFVYRRYDAAAVLSTLGPDGFEYWNLTAVTRILLQQSSGGGRAGLNLRENRFADEHVTIELLIII